MGKDAKLLVLPEGNLQHNVSPTFIGIFVHKIDLRSNHNSTVRSIAMAFYTHRGGAS